MNQPMDSFAAARTPKGLFRDVAALLVALAVCFAAAAVGSAWTMPELASWYAELRKPTWTPPNAVFGPVWSLLYTLMALAAWLVWRQRSHTGRVAALALFILQLGCNVAWSALFFGLHLPGAAFAEIVLLWCAILATLLAFRRVCTAASWLLVPYLLWVTFAAALNFAIWRLNS